MIRNFSFDYDWENDNLFLYNSRSKSKASIEFGDVIVDFNKEKQVSAIEIIDASKFFKESVSKDVTRTLLTGTKDSQVEILQTRGFLSIKIYLTLKSNKKIMTPLLIPTLNAPSPALL